jgi:hypothetical protein
MITGVRYWYAGTRFSSVVPISVTMTKSVSRFVYLGSHRQQQPRRFWVVKMPNRCSHSSTLPMRPSSRSKISGICDRIRRSSGIRIDDSPFCDGSKKRYTLINMECQASNSTCYRLRIGRTRSRASGHCGGSSRPQRQLDGEYREDNKRSERLSRGGQRDRIGQGGQENQRKRDPR